MPAAGATSGFRVRNWIPPGDDRSCNSNGFEGQLCKVPKLTGRTQPPHQGVTYTVTGVVRGQREKQNS